MDVIAIVGILAGLCSTASFAPQALKVIRTRDTSSLSTGMYSLTVVGFALWTTFGVAKGEWALIAANGICFVLAGFILAMKLLPRSERDKVASSLDSGTEESGR